MKNDDMLHVKTTAEEPASAVVDRISAAMPGLAKGDTTLADPLPSATSRCLFRSGVRQSAC